MLKQIAPCPKCKAFEGWWEKRICKYTQIFDASGEAFDASTIERVRGGERRYCINCNKDITAQVQPDDSEG